ncbi:MAG: DUF2939 domain-containing protein [Phenylobacterium sp.]|jgi:hypothetical protein|uniref:DUF2939 domain-containing protein n=1 Tax=Phenylobacterium sp. TaxID=1871053 RepID=UPI00391D936F
MIKLRMLAAALLALGAAACGDVEIRREAARDVHALLDAAYRNDRKTFGAYIDRPALRADLERQLRHQAERKGVDLSRGVDPRALDRMIDPSAVQIQAALGLGGRSVPSPDRIAMMMRVSPEGRVCLLEPSIPPACVMTFEKQGDRWRLVAASAPNIQIRTAPRG